MRPPRRKSRRPLSSTIVPSLLPIPAAASPRSSVVPVLVPATRSRTVKASRSIGSVHFFLVSIILACDREKEYIEAFISPLLNLCKIDVRVHVYGCLYEELGDAFTTEDHHTEHTLLRFLFPPLNNDKPYRCIATTIPTRIRFRC